MQGRSGRCLAHARVSLRSNSLYCLQEVCLDKQFSTRPIYFVFSLYLGPFVSLFPGLTI